MRAVDFSRSEEWRDVAYQDATPATLKRLKAWLKENPETLIVLYHGTSAKHDILKHGLLPTTPYKRRKSLQSRPGYVSFSIFCGMARSFGEMAYPGERIVVYVALIPVKRLVPDLDQLRNKRTWAYERYGMIADTLEESIAIGHGVQVRGRIPPEAIVQVIPVGVAK